VLVPSSAWNTGSPSKRGMQHHTTRPRTSISALIEQLPIIARSNGERGWPAERSGGAGRPGPLGGSLFGGIV
jgi:hypothetical protein